MEISMARDDQPDPPSSGDSDLTTRTSVGAHGEHEIIDGYRILEQVGAGGMGEVYRAEQTDPIRRTVALKIIKRGMDTKEVITRFEAERQALALMDHPSIAKVFEAGSTPRGRPYFAMEYVRGIPITTYCDEHKLSVRERLELFIQLCEGVQHAHQKAIIHRDLKPSNVLVTIQDAKPVPKIIDFGVAKATAQKLTEKTMYTALGETIGTPEYMSPEQAAMTSEDVDTRTDVYALGVILYELLVGALPFEPSELRKAGFEGIVRMIREQDPPRPSTRVGTLGDRGDDVARARRTLPNKLTSRLRGDLDWITMRALEKDRTRRYGSPSDLAADVRRHLRHEPVFAGPPSAAYRTRKFVRRHTLGVGIASAGALVLVAFAVTMAVQANRIARERDRADQEATTSDRVSEFLVSVFNVSDPGEARGNSITAREVLDNGALRIQRELSDQPLLRAKMMDTMGRVYQNLGLYSRADELLVGALELRQAEVGEEHLESVESLSHLGWLRIWQGRLDEARKMHAQVLSVRERVLGTEHVDTAWSLYYLGTTMVFGGEASRGRQLLERALPIFEWKLGPKHQATAWCLNDIGNSHMDTDPESALPFYERALVIKEETLGPDHYDVGLANSNLAYCLLKAGRLSEARSQLEKALAILEGTLGPNHFALASALHNLGEALRRLGDYEEARHTLYRALEILDASVEPEYRTYPYVLLELALLARDSGDYAEADSFFRRTLEIRDKSLQPSHPDLAKTQEEYAALLREMGRVDEAVTMEARAKAIRERLNLSHDAN
jgi:non-specific serine/threonine protein kinase/serine/threonine-protein kinase